jgi:PAS domain-containing protein
MSLPVDRGVLERTTQLILSSYRRLFGCDLVEARPGEDEVQKLFDAPFVVLSALGPLGTDHVFNYANRQALGLFEYAWDELMGKPSSASAEPVHRDERRRLLDEVGKHGFIENYSGIRISKTGRRFRIKKATVFNLLDKEGTYVGQSATFADWERLD